MATKLHRIQGEQFFDDDGAPLAGGKLHYDEAGTTTDQETFSDAAGLTPNSNPLVLDASGRLTTSVYFGDSDAVEDYKETLTDSLDVTISNWPVDDLPAATPAAAAAEFAPPLLAWTQVTNAASPVALTAADAGKAYEADTTSGNIEFDLPSAASVGDGKGFIFKKTVAANSMIIDPNGSETIDNSSTSLTLTDNNAVVGIWSNGAEWYRIDGVDATALGALLPGFQSVQVFTSSGTYTRPSGIERVLVISTGGGGGGGGADSDGSGVGAGSGGGAGGTAIELFTAAQVGASQTVTIGAGGTAGADTGGNGGAGGNTTFGSLHTATGGAAGTGISATAAVNATSGAAGGVPTGGLINIAGGHGGPGLGHGGASILNATGGDGGTSFWGGGPGGAANATDSSAVAGVAGVARGAGGSGAANVRDTTGTAGGAGAAGIVVVLEFGS